MKLKTENRHILGKWDILGARHPTSGQTDWWGKRHLQLTHKWSIFSPGWNQNTATLMCLKTHIFLVEPISLQS